MQGWGRSCRWGWVGWGCGLSCRGGVGHVGGGGVCHAGGGGVSCRGGVG